MKSILKATQNQLEGATTQHASCDVFVASHSVGRLYPGDNGRHKLSSDVINVSCSSSFSGQQCSITLVPRKPYHQFIFPNDMISVYLSTNSNARQGDYPFGVLGGAVEGWGPDKIGENPRVFFGYINGIRQSTQVDAQGKVSARITLDCSGIQKPFEKTQIYYNEVLGPSTLYGAMLPGLATLTKQIPLAGSPATLPRAIALSFLGFGGQYVLPESYPFSGGRSRSKSLLESWLKKSRDLEKALNLSNVRLQKGKGGLVQRLYEKQRKLLAGGTLGSVIDFFSYVEDQYVDGLIFSSPNHDLSGSVLSMMAENSNPMMNEMFFSLLPTKQKELQSDKDEWGQYPNLTPSLVIREKPFSWDSRTFQVPSRSKGSYRDIKFGNVFFSSRLNPANAPTLQQYDDKETAQFLQNLKGSLSAMMNGLANPPQGADSTKTSLFEGRSVDRVTIHSSDIQAETLGCSDNDTYNFWMMSLTNTPLQQQYQKFVLLTDGLIPCFLDESIRRHGLRTQELSTKFMHTGAAKRDGKNAFDFMIRSLLATDMWYQHQPYFRAGTITTPGIPKAQAGMVLDVMGDQPETFYIESVSHDWSHPGKLQTTFTVTRGMPTARPFNYGPPHVVKIKGQNRKKTRVQPQVSAIDLDLNTQDGMTTLAKYLGKDVTVKDLYRHKAEAQKVKKDFLVYLRDDVVVPELPPSTGFEPLLSSEDYAELSAYTKPYQKDHSISQKQDREDGGKPPWLFPSVEGEMRDAVKARLGNLGENAQKAIKLLSQALRGKK